MAAIDQVAAELNFHAFHLTEELRGRIKAAGLQDTYFKYAEAYAEALLCIQHIRRIFDGSVSDGNTYAIRRPQLIMAELGQYFKGMAIVEARSKLFDEITYGLAQCKDLTENERSKLDDAMDLMASTMFLALYWRSSAVMSLMPGCMVFITEEDINWAPTRRLQDLLQQYLPVDDTQELPNHHQGDVDADLEIAFMRIVGPRMKQLEVDLEAAELCFSVDKAQYRKAKQNAWRACMRDWKGEMPSKPRQVIISRKHSNYDGKPSEEEPVSCITCDPYKKSVVRAA